MKPIQGDHSQVLTAARGKVLHLVKNDRMAGMVPSWDSSPAEKPAIDSEFSRRLQAPSAPETALAYQGEEAQAQTGSEESAFRFGDLIDMVNPLQHIPVISHLYRDFTGDTIRPVSKLIGSALFGGAIGAGVALVNVVAEEATGEDLTGNAMALMMGTPRKTKAPAPELMITNAAPDPVTEAKAGAPAPQSDPDHPVWNNPAANEIAKNAAPTLTPDQFYRLLQKQNAAAAPYSAAQDPQDMAARLLALSDLSTRSDIQIFRLNEKNAEKIA